MEEKLKNQEQTKGKIDTGFHKNALEFYRKVEKWQGVTDDDKTIAGFYSAELRQLANNENLQKLKPENVAFALYDLAGYSSSIDLIPKGNTEKDAQEQFSTWMESRNLFDKSCEKIFSDLDLELTPGSIERVCDLMQGVSGIRIPGKERFGMLLNQDPQKLAKTLDELFKVLSLSEREKARLTYLEGSIKIENEKMAKIVEILYLLKILSRKVYKKIAEDQFRELELQSQEKDGENLEKEKFEMLLQEIDKRGRLASDGAISSNFETKRIGGYGGGFKIFTDAKKNGGAADQRTREIAREFAKRNLCALASEGQKLGLESEKNNRTINLFLTIQPIEISTPVFRDVQEETYGFFGNKKIITIRKQVGENKTPETINSFNGNNKDQEKAYRINCLITGDGKNPYKDPDTKRHGCYLSSNIILPESLAKELFAKLQQDPMLVLEVLRKMDPEMMAEQEKVMCKIGKSMVVPEGEIEKAFPQRAANESGPHIKINPTYVRDIK